MADLDGDGFDDILTGSYWPGDLYFFRGLAKGKFAAGEILKDSEGKNVSGGGTWKTQNDPDMDALAAVPCLVAFNRRTELERIAAPTLLIAGEEDTNAPLKAMTRMAEVVPGSRLEVLGGTGHLAPLECPERYADIVRRFLADLPQQDRA